MKRTQEQNNIWNKLFTRQLPNIEACACTQYKQGLKAIELQSDHLPTIRELNSKLSHVCTWHTTHTQVRYLTALQWARYIGRDTFPITTYLRSIEELDFTPEPDMFHDIFGHLPFFFSEDSLALTNLFAQKMLTADQETVENIVAKLWWFTIEFGLIREGNEIKAFGAGLMSSFKEIKHALTAAHQPFTIQDAIKEDPAVYSLHNRYFVIDNINTLRIALETYFKTI